MPARRTRTTIRSLSLMRRVIAIRVERMAVITGYPRVLSPIAKTRHAQTRAGIMPARHTNISIRHRCGSVATCKVRVVIIVISAARAGAMDISAPAIDTLAERIPTPIRGCGPVAICRVRVVIIVISVVQADRMGISAPATVTHAERILTPIQKCGRVAICRARVGIIVISAARAGAMDSNARAIDTHADRILTPIRGCGRVGIRIAVEGIMRG